MYLQSINLKVRNVAQSLRYYQDVLGFKEDFHHGNEDGTLMYANLQRGEAEVKLQSFDAVPEAARPFLGAGLEVQVNLKDGDVDAYYAEVKQKGAKIAVEIEDKFWGHREFVVEDLDGYRLIFTKHVKDVDFSHLKDGGGWKKP